MCPRGQAPLVQRRLTQRGAVADRVTVHALDSHYSLSHFRGRPPDRPYSRGQGQNPRLFFGDTQRQLPSGSAPMTPVTTTADLYRALLRRDASYDGLVYVGVTSTGVFCRLTCAA